MSKTRDHHPGGQPVRLEHVAFTYGSADMLFDGKVTINALSEEHFHELIKTVEGRAVFNKQLLDEGDEDGDEEELEVWENRLGELLAMYDSASWQNQA